MFWDRFYSLCCERNAKPNSLASDLKISSGVITKWKQGGLPNGETIIKIAEYFDVSVDYLLGKTDIKTKPTTLSEGDELFEFLQDPIKKEILETFKKLTPERQKIALAQLKVLVADKED